MGATPESAKIFSGLSNLNVPIHHALYQYYHQFCKAKNAYHNIVI